MNNNIFQKKSFIKDLTSLGKEMARAVKGASPQEIKENKALLQSYIDTISVAKKAITHTKEQLPPIGALDTLFEVIIEKSKVAETKPTIENKQDYKEALNKFLKVYKNSSDKDKKLWKNAFEESEIEYEKISKKQKDALAVKKRIDDFERTESAKIYCIIKGKNPDGSEWGRIDFVGRNYVMQHKDQVSKGANTNKLPLVVKYYSYEDKSYTHLKDSNHLESIFDKQLMDLFIKSDCISYESHKNLDGDYQYHPKKAGLVGKGIWYFNYANNTTNRIAKIIEVPDWNDFGFEDLFNKHIDDCNDGILTEYASKELKEQMQDAIEKQKALIKELDQFHVEKNDGDKDSQLLIEVWGKRIEGFTIAMNTELKGNCIKPFTPSQPCSDFNTPFDRHVELCSHNALPKRVGDSLKLEMQDCIDSSKKTIQEIINQVDKYKKIPGWGKDVSLKQQVEDLEKEITAQNTVIQDQEKKLAALPEECIKPIILEITFKPNNNTIASKNDAQLLKIATFLIENPLTKIKLIGNTSMKKGNSIENTVDGVFIETVETDHIMPNDDVLPADLSKEELKKIKERSFKVKDLMMIRTERVKQLFVALKVNSSQIAPVPGKCRGKGVDNQKVTLEFYKKL
jgi:outer membrane protein OmpA-like peptidoglycan-associated protein